MKLQVKIIFLLLLSLNAFAKSGTLRLSESFEINIEHDDNVVSEISQAQYNEVILKISKIYKKKIEKNGVKLDVVSDWENNDVNAFADQKNKVWSVNFFGGYARLEGLTLDAFALIVCHEFGHHLGGKPKMKDTKWASSEGQSDFWASSVCFPEVFSTGNNISFISNMKVPLNIKNKCVKRFELLKDQALCIRQIYAGDTLNKAVHKHLKRKGAGPSLLKKDVYIVFESEEDHPNEQCRIDTVISASLCNEFVFKQSCIRETHVSEHTRPLCWYRPKNINLLSNNELIKDAIIHFPEYAGRANYKKMNFAILQTGFDLNIKNKNNEDAFFKASEYNQLGVLKYLLKFKSLFKSHINKLNINPLGIASNNGHLEIVKFLIEELDVDINKFSHMGSPALYIAIKKGHLEVVEYLLSQSKIDINKGNYFGDSPLFMAIEEDNETIINILIKRKDLDLKHVNQQGDTALTLAEFYSSEELYDYLMGLDLF